MQDEEPLRYSPRAFGNSGGIPTLGQRSAFGGSYASARSTATGTSNARLFAQREKTLNADMTDSLRESSWNTSLHIVQRQGPWNSAQNGIQVPWHTHTSCARHAPPRRLLPARAHPGDALVCVYVWQTTA